MGRINHASEFINGKNKEEERIELTPQKPIALNFPTTDPSNIAQNLVVGEPKAPNDVTNALKAPKRVSIPLLLSAKRRQLDQSLIRTEPKSKKGVTAMATLANSLTLSRPKESKTHPRINCQSQKNNKNKQDLWRQQMGCQQEEQTLPCLHSQI